MGGCWLLVAGDWGGATLSGCLLYISSSIKQPASSIRSRSSSTSPNHSIVNRQFALQGCDLFTKSLRIVRVAGGWFEVGELRGPKVVERVHRELAVVFGGHRSEGGGEQLLAADAERGFNRG